MRPRYVNSGVILEAETEAEPAGVMSHEIAHVSSKNGGDGTQETRHHIGYLPFSSEGLVAYQINPSKTSSSCFGSSVQRNTGRQPRVRALT